MRGPTSVGLCFSFHIGGNDHVDAWLLALLAQAYMLEDGCTVFKSGDGSFIINEQGEEGSADISNKLRDARTWFDERSLTTEEIERLDAKLAYAMSLELPILPASASKQLPDVAATTVATQLKSEFFTPTNPTALPKVDMAGAGVFVSKPDFPRYFAVINFRNGGTLRKRMHLDGSVNRGTG